MARLRAFFERRDIAWGPWLSNPPPPWATDGAMTSAGPVSPDQALAVSAVYACVRLLSEAVGSLPPHLYQSTSGLEPGQPDYRVHADHHPIAPLLMDRPNPEMDAREFWRGIETQMLLNGNALVYKFRQGSNLELWPIPWRRVSVHRASTGRLVYRIQLDRQERAGDIGTAAIVLTSDEVMHYRALKDTGPIGLSPLSMARQDVGLAAGSLDYGARLFANDARPGGVITVPKTLSNEQIARMTARWNALHAGSRRSHLVGILEGGATWSDSKITPEEAQFLATRSFQVSQIARYFGVPPHLIGDVDRSMPRATTEQQGIEFVQFALLPWLVRIEEVTRMGLFPAGSGYYMRFSVDGLLRGDTVSRFQGYAQGRQWGWLSANDVRRMEDMDPIGPEGDGYMQPVNMVTLGAPAQAPSLDGAVRRLVEEMVSESNGHLDRHERSNA